MLRTCCSGRQASVSSNEGMYVRAHMCRSPCGNTELHTVRVALLNTLKQQDEYMIAAE